MGLLTSESRSKLLLKNHIPSTAVWLWQLKKKVVFVRIWSGTKSSQFPVLVQVKNVPMWYPNLSLLLVHTTLQHQMCNRKFSLNLHFYYLTQSQTSCFMEKAFQQSERPKVQLKTKLFCSGNKNVPLSFYLSIYIYTLCIPMYSIFLHSVGMDTGIYWN